MDTLPSSPLKETTTEFEGFAVGISRPADAGLAAAAVADVLDDSWELRRMGTSGSDYEITHPDLVLTEAEAWEIAYRLRAQPGVLYAEPLFVVSVFEDRERLQSKGPFEAVEGAETHLPLSENPEWGLRMIRVHDAWNTFFGGDPARAGEGIIIGHPDTGYGEHPEILDRLLIDDGFDFVKNDRDARDELKKVVRVLIDNPSHGTQTASVIISPPGQKRPYRSETGELEDPTQTAVVGVAPGARLIPIRTSRTVALTSMRGLVNAIHHAVDRGAHVISISMGGVPSRALKRAVRHAESQGVIVCAAAGNQVRFVVWPAGYSEVVAAAACNVNKKPWKGSSRGTRVTATAPGESVWRAHLLRDGTTITPHVGRGSGTSYAVAHVAGLAALWLSYHGRDRLVARYGHSGIPGVFRHVLRESCISAADLGKGFGAGLVDAVNLLERPLPEVTAAATPFESAGTHATVVFEADGEDAEPPIRLIAALFDADEPQQGPFEAASEQRLSATLARILGTSPERLPERLETVGDELIFHLMTDPATFDAMQKALQQPLAFEAAGMGSEKAREQLRSKPLSPQLRSALESG